MTPEARITLRIRNYLKKLRAEGEPLWWLKVHGSPMQRAGVLDLCIVWYGRAVFLEVKAPGGKVTALQQNTIRQIREAGGVAEVVTSVEEVAEVLLLVVQSRQETKS